MGQSDSHTGDDDSRVSFDHGGGDGGLEATEGNFRDGRNLVFFCGGGKGCISVLNNP